MGRQFGENGYMYMDGWVLWLFTWNYHNTVNWLFSNTKLKVYLKKEKENQGSKQVVYRLFDFKDKEKNSIKKIEFESWL